MIRDMMNVEVKEVAVGQEVVVSSGMAVFRAVVTAQNENGTTSLLRTEFGKNVRPAKNPGFVVNNTKMVGVK